MPGSDRDVAGYHADSPSHIGHRRQKQFCYVFTGVSALIDQQFGPFFPLVGRSRHSGRVSGLNLFIKIVFWKAPRTYSVTEKR